MCGISGLINKSNKAIPKEQIKSMNDLIKHRGPDDEGFYFGKNFAFGHRRLAILDLSKDGHQPMEYLQKYTITYNGEIYNYIEIKDELIKDGYKFKSNTDTEVILAGYDKWGTDCVNRFNGMWAFALYDKEKDIIFCSRDRFGIKPFYYTEINDNFVFGSEIKQLLEFYEERFVNKKILIDYLVLGFEEHSNETFFENIVKLEQSHNLVYELSNHKFHITRYYNIAKDSRLNSLTLEQSVSLYSKKLINAVKLRLRSDVKVGTCLSGGLDSSSIAAIASKKYSQKSREKFIAVHAKSTEKKGDESFFAQEVSKNSNLDLSIIEPTSNDFKKNINEVVYAQEEPFSGVSIFMQYFVMKKAKEIGCKVMLDGQGGDETLLGYERYYPAYLLTLGVFKGVREFFYSSKNSKLSMKKIIQYFFYFTNVKLRFKRIKKKYNFVRQEYWGFISYDIIKNLSKSYLNIFELQNLEIFSTQMPHLLKYEDRNSMIHSIETRLPFIDYSVLEVALGINSGIKIKNGWTKYLLRKAVENILPTSVVWRKNKFGFEAPEKSWLYSLDEEIKNEIMKSSILKKLLKDVPFSKLNEGQKWKLYNIAKWEEIYQVKFI